ncbi:MAG: hypothetical protein ACD_45C00589G0004 [uncultured bacterium]|nr:MAG: hypothetical protein ACD_45C00589G0004 [uncultured bacterium]
MNMSSVMKVFGIVFVVLGVVGFIPGLTSNGIVLGMFSTGGIYSVVYLLSGIVAFFAVKQVDWTKLYLRVVGVLYGIGAILGFVKGGNLIVMHINTMDNLLYLVIGVVALYLGFLGNKLLKK